MSKYIFEKIQEKHLPEVLDIYNYYVLHSTATFHTKALSMEEMKKLVFSQNPKYKTFAIVKNNLIYGYISLIEYKKRQAYNETAEITIYLKPDYIGKGIGSVAIQFIEKYAKTNAFHALIAIICGENKNSIKLFKRNGYTKCAHFKEVGKKFDRYLDVVAFQKII